jgi:hypothetical protein
MKRRRTFFLLWWDWFGFLKKCTWTCYIELMFLHPVGSARHIVHSGASGARNIDALDGTRDAVLVFLHPF